MPSSLLFSTFTAFARGVDASPERVYEAFPPCQVVRARLAKTDRFRHLARDRDLEDQERSSVKCVVTRLNYCGVFVTMTWFSKGSVRFNTNMFPGCKEGYDDAVFSEVLQGVSSWASERLGVPIPPFRVTNIVAHTRVTKGVGLQAFVKAVEEDLGLCEVECEEPELGRYFWSFRYKSELGVYVKWNRLSGLVQYMGGKSWGSVCSAHSSLVSGIGSPFVL